MTEQPALERTTAVRLIGAAGHVVGLGVVVVLIQTVVAIADDISNPDEYWAGLTAGLGGWLFLALLGSAAPLLTFRPRLQHLVFASSATFAVVCLPMPQNLVMLAITGMLIWPWSYLLRTIHPSRGWTRSDWWTRALTFAIIPALVCACSIRGGLRGNVAESVDPTPAELLDQRIWATWESVVVLGPAWGAAVLAIYAPPRWRPWLFGVVIGCVGVALVVLPTSINQFGA